MSWIRELKMAALSLKRAPGFVITSVGTLALTLAVLLLVVSISSAFLIKPLVYPDEEQLIVIEQQIIMANYDDSNFQTIRGQIHWHKHQSALESLALIKPDDNIFMSLPGEPRLPISYVTPEYFDLFAVPLQQGRAFNRDESLDDKAKVVLISEQLWRTAFNSNEDILEQSLVIDKERYRIIGVVARGYIEPHMFEGVDSQVWIPFDANRNYDNNWGNTFSSLRAIGKLPPGAGLGQIETELENLIEQTRPQWAQDWPELLDINPRLRSFRDVEVGDKSQLSLMLLAGAVSLLLIAIVNVTNLFFSRAVAKQKMLAIQAILGARRKRLFYALLSESSLICCCAMLLGLFLAAWGLKGFVLLAQGELPLLHALSLDTRVLITALGIALLLSVLFAFTTSRLIDYQQLRRYIQSSGKGGATQVSGRTVRVLIVAQITLASLLLLFSAMILSKALASKSLQIGANIDNVYNVLAFTTNSDLSLAEKRVMGKAIRDTLLKEPTIAKIGYGSAPISTRRNAHTLTTLDGEQLGFIRSAWIHKDYFDTYEIELLAGRQFSDAAYRQDALEMIVSESAAKKLAPEGNALGKSFIGLDDKPYEIVGIVEDVNDPNYHQDDFGMRVWWPYQMRIFSLQVKVKPGHALTREWIASKLKRINDRLTLWEFTKVEQTYQDSLYQETLTIYLTTVLGLFTLLLASAGIYGVLSYNISLRRFEFGVRMALGAKKKQLYTVMGRESLLPVALGLALSMLMTTVILLLFRSKLQDWIMLNIPSLAIALVLTLIIAVIACALPIRALLNGNPISALRNE